MSTAESKAGLLQRKGLILPNIGRIVPLLFVFLYFLFSSAELLHMVITIFKPKISQIMAVLLLSYLCLSFRRMTLPRSILYPSTWLLLSMLVSALLSAHPLRCCIYAGGYIFNFIFYFLIPVNLFRFFDSKTILRTYSLAFSCLGFYAISQLALSWLGIYDPLATQRIGTIARGQGWTYEPSYYALYITAYVMFRNALAIFGSEEFSLKKALKLLGINTFLLASTSTGVIFSYPVFFFVCLGMVLQRPIRRLASYARKRILKFVAICCALGGILSWLFWEHFVMSFFKFFYFGFMTHGSFVARWEGIVSCFRLFKEHPLFGVGVGGVGPYLFAKNSWYDTSPVTLQEVESFDPTNVFTEILASLGIVGLVGFVWLSFVFYRSFRKVFSAQVAQSDKIVAIALFISLILVMFVLQFNQGLFRPYVWIHIGIFYGYLRKTMDNSASSVL
jgi:O-antigen ligase